MKNTKTTHFALALLLMVFAAPRCSNPVNSDSGGGNIDENWSPKYVCAEYTENDELDRSLPSLGLTNVVVVDFGTAAVPTDLPSGVTLRWNGRHAVVNTGTATAINIVLRGATTNGSVKIFGDNRFNLFMHSVNIKNPTGPAINIQNNSRVEVYLVGNGCGANSRNILEDGAGYGTGAHDPDANDFIQTKGTFFSEASLRFHDRGGSLEITSKNNHALVTDDHLVIHGGNIIIYESANDGIHVNDYIEIRGGTLQIRSVGDAIQNERGEHDIIVAGGNITLFTTGRNGHGITSDSGNVLINGGTLKIDVIGNGSKGLRSSRESVIINGGATYIIAAGDIDYAPHDTSTAAGIKTRGNTEIHGGTLNITGAGENTRGINSDADVVITDGNVAITARGDGIQVEGDFVMSGGTVFARSIGTQQDIDCRGNARHTGGSLDAVINGRTPGGF